MNRLKDDSLHEELALRDEPRAKVPARQLDLGLLASKLSAIASELRGADAIAIELSPAPPHSSEHHLVETESPRPTGAQPGFSPKSRSQDALTERSVFGQQHRARKAYASYAREVYATRRRRSNIFGSADLFGEPAWDILLDLYIASVENKPVSVSSACIGSAAPPTTGLRWLGVLSENGLVLREHDPEDQRRVLVRLTERGLAAMDEFFASTGHSA